MSDPKPPFILTPDERDSRIWKRLMAHFNERLETLRVQNDGVRAETETAHLRGRITELKRIIDLNKEPIDFEAPPR